MSDETNKLAEEATVEETSANEVVGEVAEPAVEESTSAAESLNHLSRQK